MNKDEFKELLHRVHIADGSLLLLNHLHYEVQKEKNKSSNGRTVNRKTHQNKFAEAISVMIFEYVPEDTFWEEEVSKIISDMVKYDFCDNPSLNTKIKKDVLGKKRLSAAKIECFESINLLEHTYNVVSVAYEYAQNDLFKKEDNFHVLMGALLHDYGKSSVLVHVVTNEIQLSESKRHEEYSHIYIEQRIETVRDYLLQKKMNGRIYSVELNKYKKISDGVLNHHKENHDVIDIIYYIQEVDKEARRREWVRFLENNDDRVRDKIIGDIYER